MEPPTFGPASQSRVSAPCGCRVSLSDYDETRACCPEHAAWINERMRASFADFGMANITPPPIVY